MKTTKIVFLLFGLCLLVSVASQDTTECPPDAPRVRCEDPCANTACPGVQEARCVPNVCGMCNYTYVNSDGRDVTQLCYSSQCPSGVPMVNCFVNPCLNKTCPGFPDARCVPNYCGGCMYSFVDITDGRNVTSHCNQTLVEECPLLSDGTFGTCTQLCNPNEDGVCATGQRCCSNGCGTMCTNPVNVTVCVDQDNRTYHVGDSFMAADGCNTCFCSDDGSIRCTEIACISITGCPSSDSTLAGICISSCETDDQCTNGQICCAGVGGCARACVDPVPVCLRDRMEYQINETFPAGDGCNNCTCNQNGLINCTQVRCIDPCYDEPDIIAGDCLLALPIRYYYDSRSSICRNYTRGCDADSRNDFRSALECYDRCNSQSVCNSLIYPLGFVSTCLVIGRRWTFNVTQGRCLEFKYPLCGQTSKGYDVFESLEDCTSTCIRPNTTTPDCPAGYVSCLANPCFYSRCSNYPNATCTPNFCGGCNAHFFHNERNVTDLCETRDTCDDGSLIFRCFADPCINTACPAVSGARCVADYCGGCNYKYLNAAGMDITNQCNRSLPVPVQQAVCPNVNASLASICVSSCSGDSGCERGQLCCPNSCGRVCTTPTYIPHYSVAPVCPPLRSDFVGICLITDTSCTENSQCSRGQLCCRTGCGRTCQNATRSEVPCFTVSESIHAALGDNQTPPPGYFVPTCQNDGTFSPVQCSPSTNLCWCVDINSGEPVSSYYPRGVRPNCSGAGQNPGCNYNDRSYAVGATFPSTDDCNKCSCTDNGVICTLRACYDLCSLRPETGPCRASIQAYYFDQASGMCRQFTYGGCQGNENKFATIRDCLIRCNATSRCLQAKTPGPCEAYGPSFYFNNSTSRCEFFVYGGCQGNENRFASGTECTRACSPDTKPFDCATRPCSLPTCEGNSELVDDDPHCCPYCRPNVQECERDEYTCSDGECINRDRRCDDLRDCSDGGDERGCDRDCEFRCSDGSCIRQSEVCDTIVDCRDGSDVRNCSTTFSNVYYLTHRDIPLYCPDRSDIYGECGNICVNNTVCRNGTICCSNNCGRTCTCTVGIQRTPLCPSIQSQSRQSGLLGVFSPRCQADGSFMDMQCHEGFCWCADVITGQPVSEGTRDANLQCGSLKCRGRNGMMLSIGESQSSEDGCNTCTCTSDLTLACSRRNCDTAPCRFGNLTIASNITYQDVCSICRCFAGALNCTRKDCTAATAALKAVKRRFKTTIPFNGDYSMVSRSEGEFIRQVLRSFLEKYRDSLGVTQDQFEKVEVKEGSVIVILTITDTNATTDGANATLLVGQIQQDFENDVLIIRYEGQVLEPTGTFQIVDLSSEQSTDDTSAGLEVWHIAVIVVGGALLLTVGLIVAVIVAVVVKKRRTPEHGFITDKNDYELKRPL